MNTQRLSLALFALLLVGGAESGGCVQTAKAQAEKLQSVTLSVTGMT